MGRINKNGSIVGSKLPDGSIVKGDPVKRNYKKGVIVSAVLAVVVGGGLLALYSMPGAAAWNIGNIGLYAGAPAFSIGLGALIALGVSHKKQSAEQNTKLRDRSDD